jgi:hypothetical protein
MTTEQQGSSSLREALSPAALREALVPRRPVFADPWESTVDMFACCMAVAVVDPFLLWLGGKLMGSIFGFSSHWQLGVFMVAGLVGAAGFITIVGRERTRLSVDVMAITAWVLLGLVIAPVIGLAPPAWVAIVLYAVMLAAIFVYVLFIGRWQTTFLQTVTWPLTWSLLALFFCWAAYELILY